MVNTWPDFTEKPWRTKFRAIQNLSVEWGKDRGEIRSPPPATAMMAQGCLDEVKNDIRRRPDTSNAAAEMLSLCPVGVLYVTLPCVHVQCMHKEAYSLTGILEWNHFRKSR